MESRADVHQEIYRGDGLEVSTQVHEICGHVGYHQELNVFESRSGAGGFEAGV